VQLREAEKDANSERAQRQYAAEQLKLLVGVSSSLQLQNCHPSKVVEAALRVVDESLARHKAWRDTRSPCSRPWVELRTLSKQRRAARCDWSHSERHPRGRNCPWQSCVYLRAYRGGRRNNDGGRREKYRRHSDDGPSRRRQSWGSGFRCCLERPPIGRSTQFNCLQ
jgi:hypothetical protein